MKIFESLARKLSKSKNIVKALAKMFEQKHRVVTTVLDFQDDRWSILVGEHLHAYCRGLRIREGNALRSVASDRSLRALVFNDYPKVIQGTLRLYP